MIALTRSNPIPVSTWRWGKGEKLPSGLALNWMKTRFQISMHRGSPALTNEPLVSPARRKVDVKLGAGSARAGVAHHPKIVLLVSVDDVNHGI